jgi:hypothetical protein
MHFNFLFFELLYGEGIGNFGEEWKGINRVTFWGLLMLPLRGKKFKEQIKKSNYNY